VFRIVVELHGRERARWLRGGIVGGVVRAG
jgi:hypothetical protein